MIGRASPWRIFFEGWSCGNSAIISEAPRLPAAYRALFVGPILTLSKMQIAEISTGSPGWIQKLHLSHCYINNSGRKIGSVPHFDTLFLVGTCWPVSASFRKIRVSDPLRGPLGGNLATRAIRRARCIGAAA